MIRILFSNLLFRFEEWRTKPIYQFVEKGERRG